MASRVVVKKNVQSVIFVVVALVALIKASEACSIIHNVTSGYIRSPRYPIVYPSNTNCSWLIKVPLGNRIRFTFITFELESEPTCSYDYIKILDGGSYSDPVIGHYCSTTPSHLDTSGHAAIIIFRSSPRKQFSGFEIFYSAIPVCGGFLNVTSGYIRSPRYPIVYPSNINCSWLIQVPLGNRIGFTFVTFELESEPTCSYDYIKIFDGESDSDPVIGHYCSTTPSHLYTSGHTATIFFRSDPRKEFSGFKIYYYSIPGDHLPCNSDQFPCFNGKCIRRSRFCDETNDCGDNSDERFCDEHFLFSDCPTKEFPWTYCHNWRRCYPSVWKCDGTTDCPDGSDEMGCQYGVRLITGVAAAERNLTHYFLNTRRQNARVINKWGPHVTRIATALFLTDRQFFSPSNRTGEEITYELSLQLMSKLSLKRKVSTHDLSLFINALTVACINPKDFFGVDLVAELRKRVNNSNYTNPFSILTLCTAKDIMTSEDIRKLQQLFDAHFRPLWTDTQAMVIMALSCISSRSDINFDEKFLDEMVSKLKRKHKNGTIDNLKTTALVVQALTATGNQRKDFNLSAAVKFIVQEVKRTYVSIQDIYYILPIFSSKSLVNISSGHCINPVTTDLEVINKLRESLNDRIQIQVSVIIGDDMIFSRTWKIKVPAKSTFYQVLENMGTLEPAYKVKYSVSEGKPYVVGLSNYQDDTEDNLFWFIYTKPLSSEDKLTLIKESPVDIQVKESEELILWYKSGVWNDIQERTTSG